MPDVGVLQLEIRDNSTEAGQGLGVLANALSKVQKAIGTKGIDFQSIATGVTALKDSAQGSEKAITSISSLFNALANFGRVKDLKLDKIATAFTEIKAAVGSGFNIGNAGYNLNQMRLAFTGDWGSATDTEGKIHGAVSGMMAIKDAGEEFKSANTAGTIRDVANAISELSNATGTIGSGGAHDLYQMLGSANTSGFRELGYNSALGMEDGIQKGTERVAQAAEDMTYAAMDAVAETQQSNSPAVEFIKLGEYAGEGYAEGLKNKIEDAIKIASEFTTAIISSAKDNAPEAARQAAEFTQSIVTGVLGNVNLPETQKAVIGQALTVASDFTRSIVDSSKGNIEQAAKIAGEFTQSILSKTVGDALSSGLQGNELKSDIDETSKGFNEAEKVFKNVGETIEGTKNSIENMSESLATAKTAVGSTLKEFEGLEKNKSFRSYMYGPRNDISISGMGFQPGYETDEERMAKNPQWYQPEEFYEKIASAATKATDPVKTLNETMEETQHVQQATADPNTTYIDNLIENASNIDLLNMRLESMTDRLYEGASSGQMTGEQIANMVTQIQALKSEIDGLSGANFNLGISFNDLKTGIQRMFPTLTQMVKRLGTIAKYRFIRSIIKHITSGFNEGLKNMYEYSKAVGGTFAPAMDSAASAIATMKNSLGAALAPAIQAVIPYVNQLVNWFIQAVNWANQLFALLGGQSTWTRALPATVNAFDKQKKAAKGAGNAIKDLLADWDELNIIQSESGKGGGAGTTNAEDYLKMFEEVGKFDNDVKDIVGYVKDHMGDVLNVVKDIGLAILGWKFSHAFTGLLGKLGSLIAIGLTVQLSADITKFFDQAYVDTQNETMLFADGIMAAALAGVSGKLASASFGKAVGEITAGITLAVSAGATFSTAKEALEAGKDAESQTLTVVGGIKGAIADALVTAGFLASGVALPLAIVGGIATVTVASAISFSLTYTAEAAKREKEMAEEAFRNKTKGGLDPAKYIEEIQIKVDEITKDSSVVITANVEFNEMKDKVSTAMTNIEELTNVVRNGSLTKEEAKQFKDNWKIIVDTLNDMNSNTYDTILSGLNSALAKATGEAKAHLEELRTSYIQIQKGVDEQTAGMMKEMEDIVGRLANNSYKSESEKKSDIERYTQLAKAVHIITDTTYDEIEKAIERGKGIDFSETGLEGAQQWISDVSNTVEEAKKLKESEYESYVNAFNYEKKKIDALLEAGIIDDTYAENAKKNYDMELAELRKMIDDDISGIDAKMNEAFRTVLEGAFNGEISNEEWRNIIVPLLKQIKEAGGEIPDFVLDAMKEGMEGNLNEGLGANYFWSLFRNSGDFGLQRTASEAVQAINDRVEQLVKEGHGETWFIDLSNLYGIDGIDLLSEDWKQDILSYAREAGLDDAFIDDLMKELGLTEDKKHKVEKHVEAAVKETFSEPMKNKSIFDSVTEFFSGLAYQAPTEDTPRVELPENYNPMGWMDIFGIAYQPPETPVEIPVKITIEPIVDSDELYQQIRDKIINSDMPDTSVPLEQTFELWQNDEQEVLQELRNRIDQFGIDQAFDMLTNFLNGDDWTLGKMPNMTRASVPEYIPQTNGAFLNGTETVKTESANPAQEATNVETGVARANKPLEDLVRELIRATNRVGDRPVTVSLFPSSGWGSTNRQSESRYEAVTGFNV